MTTESAPRLLVTDTLGQRIIAIDKPTLTLGRRSETDVRVQGAGISRVHAEIVTVNGVCRMRDKESRFGTFVNGEQAAEQVLAHGDRIRLGEAGETGIVFFVGDEAPSVRRRARWRRRASSARWPALLEGLRALGSGRVVDDVLALVLDSAIEVTGAERGFIMLADRAGQLEFKLARARGQLTLPGRTFATSRKIPETCSRPDSRRHRRGSARRRAGAAAHRDGGARHPSRALHAAAPGPLRRARRR